MEDLSLLIDLHLSNSRQGPGSEADTERALSLAGIDRNLPLKVVDIGCGTGASTLYLAEHLNAEITAVDFLPEFLEALKDHAESRNLSDKIKTLAASMEALPFKEHEFDVIWAEGSIYNMGFQKGIENWKQFLKPGGILVASEITWLTNHRPKAIESHWNRVYPEIDLASAKIRQLEAAGYSPIGYFSLPESSWTDHYYSPLQTGFESFLERKGPTEEAKALVAEELFEIELYERYKDYYSYGVYIARKI